MAIYAPNEHIPCIKKGRTVRHRGNMLALSITSSLRTSSPSSTKSNPRSRAFTKDFLAKTKLFGGPAARRPGHSAGTLDKSLRFDKPAEILLVKTYAGDCFHGALQFQQGEFRRHRFEYDRSVFHLAPQPAHCSGEDAPVIKHHGGTKLGDRPSGGN